MNIHVKNVNEESWERFKQELERISGSDRPGLGKALSDALDYYRVNVLQTRARKEWGGGAKKKVFKTKDKLKYLISELIRDLEENAVPEFWNFKIVKTFDIQGYEDITYKYFMKKKAVRSILNVVDRHTITNYIHSLEACDLIEWDAAQQAWALLGTYPYKARNIAIEVLRKRFTRKGTPEYEQYTEKVLEGSVEDIFSILPKPKKEKKSEIWQDIPIIVETGMSQKV